MIKFLKDKWRIVILLVAPFVISAISNFLFKTDASSNFIWTYGGYFLVTLCFVSGITALATSRYGYKNWLGSEVYHGRKAWLWGILLIAIGFFFLYIVASPTINFE